MYTELNALCLAILILIFFNVHRRREQLLAEERLFLLLVYCDAAILVFDSVMWLLDGLAGSAVLYVNTAMTVLYIALNPIMCLIWYLYVEYQITMDTGHLKKVLLPLCIPAAVNIALTFSSIWTGAIFYFDGENRYHRGSLFLVMALICLFYMAYAWVRAMTKRRRIPRQDFIPISIFMILPFLGGLLQTLFYGISIVWACTTLSILIIFVHIQNHRLHTDYLTGLYNRRHLDRYLHQMFPGGSERLLAGLMIDVDDFKNINDKFGHSAGDKALVDTSEILQKTFRKNDFIARYGGDEFVVVVGVREKDDLQRAIDRLQENVAAFNARKSAPYTISLSIGYDCFSDQEDASAKEFIRRLDDLMYKDKQGNITDHGMP
jgi:diguanylate cyclase (GGDEF)-like protein